MANSTAKVKIPWNGTPLSTDLLMILLAGGVLALGMVNPAFLTVGALMKAFQKEDYKRNKKKFQTSFKYLKTQGFLRVEAKNGQVYLSLTPKGRKQAETHVLAKKLADLRLDKTKKGKYLILFDVKSEDKLKRDAFRSLLKRLGCIQIQKSVWLSLCDCRKEVDFLKEFFGMTTAECRVVEVKDMGGPLPS